MNIIFNETELEIFRGQTHFSFGKWFYTSDGEICAIDRQSAQIFIGKDLCRSNVRSLSSIQSATLEEDGSVCLTLQNSKQVRVLSGGDDASEMISVIDEFAVGQIDPDPGTPDAQEACEYFDGLDNKSGEDEAETPVAGECLERFRQRDAILEVVSELRPGDKIRFEYKPLIGKARIVETEYRYMNVELNDSRYFSISQSADDLHSLLESISSDLFGYIYLNCICQETASEVSYRLKRLSGLRKL